MRNPFRRTPFPAKPAGEAPAPAPEEIAAEPEIMRARVDIEDVPISRSLQELAADIVKNPAFDAVCRRLRSDQLSLLVSTTPEQTDIREKAYHRISALDDIVLSLAALGVPESKLHPKRVTGKR